jgi:NitT/TauT family transport system substrate-binding protein
MTTRRRFIELALAAPVVLRSSVLLAQSAGQIVMALPSAGFIYLPVYVAQGFGFFREEGLDINPVVFDKGASAALTAVIGGGAAIYVGLPAVPLQAFEKGQPTKMFAGLFSQCGSEIVLQSEAVERGGINGSASPKEKAASLRGLKIAVAGAGSITDLLVRHIAKFGDLDPDRDLTIIPIGGGPNMLAAFARRRIDGFCLSSPTSTTGIVSMGGVSLFDFSRGEYPPLRNFLYTAVSASDDWLSNHEDTARKVVRSLSRALIAMRRQPDEAKSLLREFYPRTEMSILEQGWNNILPGFASSLVIEREGVQRNYEFLRDARGDVLSTPIEETFTNVYVSEVNPP